MKIIKIKKNENGGHNNQTWPDGIDLPGGYAVVSDTLETPNFPFGEIAVEEIDGVPTVVSWTPLPIPEPEPESLPQKEPTQLDQIQAQVTYTAMKTNTLIGGAE